MIRFLIPVLAGLFVQNMSTLPNDHIQATVAWSYTCYSDFTLESGFTDKNYRVTLGVDNFYKIDILDKQNYSVEYYETEFTGDISIIDVSSQSKNVLSDLVGSIGHYELLNAGLPTTVLNYSDGERTIYRPNIYSCLATGLKFSKTTGITPNFNCVVDVGYFPADDLGDPLAHVTVGNGQPWRTPVIPTDYLNVQLFQFGYFHVFAANDLEDMVNSVLDTVLQSKDNYNLGYHDGYSVGYSSGESVGYSSGYSNGYNEGFNSDSTAQTIFNNIINVAMLPVNMFLTIFNFEILGINIGSLISVLFTAAVCLAVVRICIKGGL